MLDNSSPKTNKRQIIKPLKAEVYQYNAVSDGEKRIFTNQDELVAYGNKGILAPDEVSYYNLFINGVLQPRTNYELSKGLLILTTLDVPLRGVIIILSFVTFFNEKFAQLNLASAEGLIPSGETKAGPASDLEITVNSLPQPLQSPLVIEISYSSGPQQLSVGQLANWIFACTITNSGTSPIRNLAVADTILLDRLLWGEATAVSKGEIRFEGKEIKWHVDSLEIGESAYVVFRIRGCFTATGTRYLNRAWALGDTSGKLMKSSVSSGEPIIATGGLNIVKIITSGPLELQLDSPGKWRVEIKITNATTFKAGKLIMTDELFLDSLNKINPISISHGAIAATGKEIVWNIAALEAMETAALVIDIEGSFSEVGSKSLDRAEATGENVYGQLVAGPTEDISISVSAAIGAAAGGLKIEKEILGSPLVAFKDKYKEWCFALRIYNLSKGFIKDVIVVDYILLDELVDIKIEAPVSGEIEAADGSIFWRIQELGPGSSLTATIKVGGYFKATGLRSLNRAMATGHYSNNNCFTMTGIEAGASIRVLDIQQDLRHTCIITDKVFWQCQDRCFLEGIYMDLIGLGYRDILFKPGYIPQDSINISKLEHRPHFKRVRLKIRIPFGVNTPDGKVIEAYLPDIYKDIIMFLPETANQLSYEIIVETKTELLKTPVVVNKQLNLSVGVFILLKAVGKAQLMIPYYDYCPEAAEGKDYSMTSAVHTISFDKNYDSLYPLQRGCNTSRRKGSCIPPPMIFGALEVEKYIVAGPLTVNSLISTWRVEIKVTNNGHGPVSFIKAFDELLLNSVHSVEAISSSQGTISVKGRLIEWDIGTLYSFSSAVLLLDIAGSFDIAEMDLSVVNLQYNTVSNGEKREFTNADELTIYGDAGIPGPDDVTFYSLFINGALQPPVNYAVSRGHLLLTTVDVPLEGAPVILQSMIVKDGLQQLLKADTYQYNALAGNQRSYTDSDELTMYGDKGILPPEDASLYNLYINSVLQPPINYWVVKGLLTLTTSNLPHLNAPVSLQYITIYM